ncbi:MAG: hypothetical protein HY682_01795 [Chloroflexi bacterium]|nr:hypothetical protein [Chloroflexota bacterium]
MACPTWWHTLLRPYWLVCWLHRISRPGSKRHGHASTRADRSGETCEENSLKDLHLEAGDSVERQARPRVSGLTWTLAALIVIAGLASSAGLALWGLHTRSDPYEQQIVPLVEQYNQLVRRWNQYVEQFNATPPAAVGEPQSNAAAGFELTTRLAADAQYVIVKWRAIEPPPRLAESHRLAADAMRTTQSAFSEMALYLDDLVRFGVGFEDKAEAAQLKLEQASELLRQARAAARPPSR